MRFKWIFALVIVVFITAISCNNLKMTRENKSPSSKQSGELASDGNSEAIKILENFPAARKGYQRFVILPEQIKSGDIENSYRIEIIPGKTILVDCNHHALTGTMAEKELEGLGYSYYEFNSNGQIISTKKGCPDNTQVEKFIPGETKIAGYNSKLPLVIYVPQGFEVKFKIWHTNELQPAFLK